MKTKFISIILLGASLGLGSCSDYLDMTPTDKASDKLVWSKPEYAEQAVNDFYRYIDYLGVYRDGQCLAGMTEALTDQLKYGSYNYMSKCQIPSEIAYGGSVLTVSYVSTYLGNWGTMYEYVRRVNEGINKLKKYASFGQTEQERLEAEMRFFRGYLYTDLIKRYKEVIIYDEDLDNIKKDMPVSSEAEGWNFVYEDLKFAGEHLPVDKTPNGRLTSGAAYAMLSRAMLYAERWDDARIAAEEVMGMGYKLEEKENYSNAFKAGSQEAILQYCYDKSSTVTHDFDGYMAPGGDKALDGNSMTGGFGTPTQEMVESYEDKNGNKVDWSEWHGTTTKEPPYDQLEPRFAATIIYRGCTWKGRVMDCSVGGTNGAFMAYREQSYSYGKTTTGYFLRKLLDEKLIDVKGTKSSQAWVEIRFAEVLLNKAEAAYRLNKTTEAQSLMNRVRGRQGVNLPGKSSSGEAWFNDYRNERKIELAYEGHLFWDMRRWRLAHIEYNNYRCHGLKITNGTYEYIDCDGQDRKFPQKLYVLPVPTSEIKNNALIEQYDEWK